MDKAGGPGGTGWWPWGWPSIAAPGSLNQPILSNLSFLSVTEQNSSRPETEREIVASESYGRQIGRLMDAVLALMAERPADAPRLAALDDLEALHARIQQIKCDAAEKRIERLREDLASLKEHRHDAYAASLAELRRLIDGQ